MDDAAIEWTTGFLLSALARDAPIDPTSLTFLLRRAVDRPDVREALEPALARALDEQSAVLSADGCAAWLTLFAAASALTDDDRVERAAVDVAERLRRGWPRSESVASTAIGIDACLASVHLAGLRARVSDAVDELERVVAGVYAPGCGLALQVNDESSPRGRLADHVRLSSALLTAFDVTGRLPYSMLAEELTQWIRRTIWDETSGLFRASPLDAHHPFALNCDAARVLGRLASLHDQDAYRQAAVVASGAAYLRDADRILAVLSATYQQQGLESAVYGLALIERLALQ